MVAREKASLATRLRMGWSCGGGEDSQVVLQASLVRHVRALLLTSSPSPLSNKAATMMGPQNSEEGLGVGELVR